MMASKHSASIEKDFGDHEISPADLQQWADWGAQLPSDAKITPIIGTGGHQRDPITLLRGFKATWKDE